VPPRRRLDADKVLPDLVRKLLSIGDPDDLLAGVLDLCGSFLGCDHVTLMLAEGDELVPHDVHGAALKKAKYRLKIGRQGLSGAAAAERRTIVVPDVRRDKRYFKVLSETRSEADVPILAGDRLIGVLIFESSRLGYFAPRDRHLLELVASQIAVGMRLNEAHRRSRRLSVELGMLNNLSRVGTMMEPAAFLGRVADVVRRTFECAYVGIFQGDYPNERLVLVAQSSSVPVDCAPGYVRPLRGGLVGETFRLGETINVRNVRKDPRFIDYIPGIQSEIDVPIRAGDRCVGILDAQSMELGAFTDDEVEALETLARFLVPKLLNAGTPQPV
jgi:putative methionine-R-sulfoxide reductase with GAF domain